MQGGATHATCLTGYSLTVPVTKHSLWDHPNPEKKESGFFSEAATLSNGNVMRSFLPLPSSAAATPLGQDSAPDLGQGRHVHATSLFMLRVCLLSVKQETGSPCELATHITLRCSGGIGVLWLRQERRRPMLNQWYWKSSPAR